MPTYRHAGEINVLADVITLQQYGQNAGALNPRGSYRRDEAAKIFKNR